MKLDTKDPQLLARVALTSLRLARIHQNFFSDSLELRWDPVDPKGTAKAASAISGQVGQLFPCYQMWEEDFDAAETISNEIPITVLGFTIDEVMDMAGGHPWHDLEVYLFAVNNFWGMDVEESAEELHSRFGINEPTTEIWKIFLKLEMLLANGDERLQEHPLMWRNMARRLRYLTANTEHQFLDRDTETQSYSGQIVPWEKEWIDGLAAQWREAEPYLDSTWAFVNWVTDRSHPENYEQALAVVRMVCEAVAEDEELAKASLSDVREGINSEHGPYVDYLAVQQILSEMDEDEHGEENEAN